MQTLIAFLPTIVQVLLLAGLLIEAFVQKKDLSKVINNLLDTRSALSQMERNLQDQNRSLGDAKELKTLILEALEEYKSG